MCLRVSRSETADGFAHEAARAMPKYKAVDQSHHKANGGVESRD